MKNIQQIFEICKFIRLALNASRHYRQVESGNVEGAYCGTERIDENFESSELEWVIKRPRVAHLTARDGVVVYGLMMRLSQVHPASLPSNAWWHDVETPQWDCSEALEIEQLEAAIGYHVQSAEDKHAAFLKAILGYPGSGYFPQLNSMRNSFYSEDANAKLDGFNTVSFRYYSFFSLSYLICSLFLYRILILFFFIHIDSSPMEPRISPLKL